MTRKEWRRLRYLQRQLCGMHWRWMEAGRFPNTFWVWRLPPFDRRFEYGPYRKGGHGQA